MPVIRNAVRLALLCAVLAPAALPGQEAPRSMQERAQLQFEELHESMQRLQVALQEASPAESEVLRAGNKYVQEMRVPELMTEAGELLAAGRWDEAIERMRSVHDRLQSLMNLLLNRDLDLVDLLEQIELLENFAERVDELIEQQHAEKEDAARSAALQQHLAELARTQVALEELIAAQRELREQANAAGLSAPVEAAREMTAREAELEAATTTLADRAAALEQQHEQLGSDGKAGASSAPAKGSGSCQAAAGAMGEAAGKLGQNQPESSLEDMDRALRELDEASQALAEMAEQTRRELLELPFEEQAGAQQGTQVATDQLAQDMEGAAPDESGDTQQAATPGAENVQQAVPKQKAAAGQLKEHKPGAAVQEQQDAQQQLEDARQKLEDALAQLRQQLKDEVLRALEERFAAMLAEQEELTARTALTDRLRAEALTADGVLPAAMVERCRGLAGGESALAGEAGDALKLLNEEGTTAVFPELVEELHGDLERVADRLRANRTDGTTRAMQAEIEETLGMLLDALRKSIEDGESQGQGQCDGQPPLVPMSAELKLILSLQKRVHARTVDYDTQVPEQTRVNEEARDEAAEIARKQGRVQELTRKLATKLNKESEAQEKR